MKITRTVLDVSLDKADLATLLRGSPLRIEHHKGEGDIVYSYTISPEILRSVGGKPMRALNGSSAKYSATSNGINRRSGPCPYCHTFYRVLVVHVKRKHPGKAVIPDGKYACHRCPQRFPTERSLTNHLTMAHQTKRLALPPARNAKR